MSKWRAALLAALVIMGGSCKQTEQSGGGDREPPFYDAVKADFFRGNLTIQLSWEQDAGADNYAVLRSEDGIGGPGPFETVYRGRETYYLDRDVESDGRYVYRLDKEGDVYITGRETTLAVGSAGEVDINEPNDSAEEATALGSFKKGTIYYFRFSDGRTLEDADWYGVRRNGAGPIYIRIIEEGAGVNGSLYVQEAGKPASAVVSGAAFQINASSGDYVYFAVRPAAGEFVSPGMAGGTVRSYRIEITDAGGTQSPGGGGSGTGGSGTGGSGTGTGGGALPGEPEERSELFAADASGRIIFYTNETKYMNHDYTFWKRLAAGAGSFGGMTMSLIKESGNQAGGYGFYFQGGVVAGHGECMLTVLLQKDGNYTIGKVVDGVYQTLKWWRSSPYLRAGYGVSNTVGVRWDGAANEYALEINGIEVDRFSDGAAPVCAGGGRGVIAVVASGEKFPQAPVKVWYMER
jgi:hypothetical protein